MPEKQKKGHTDHVGIKDIDRRVDVYALPDPSCDVEEEVTRRITSEDIRRAIFSLDERHREVARRRFLEDLSEEEVALVIGVTLSALAKIQEEAREALRKKLLPVMIS